MALFILRCVFVMVAAGLGVSFIPRLDPDASKWLAWGVALGPVAIAAVIIVGDLLLRRKRIDVISAVFFGTLVGLFLTYVVGLALTPIIPFYLIDESRPLINVGMAIALSYICTSLFMQTRDDFRFIIPYVEFSKELKGVKPYVLDTSVVIDGRIADVVETNVLTNQLIMPRFALAELQAIADSTDRLRRGRGRRGLDVLNRLRNNKDVDLQIYDRDLPEFEGQPVDLKLVLLAKHLEGMVITNDYNLNKVARLHDVRVVNLNELANALKPVYLPGERLDVYIVKHGEEAGQGVGYLDDGTMIVVEGGRDHLHATVTIEVTSVLQTSAGRMIFGRYDAPAAAKAPRAATSSKR